MRLTIRAIGFHLTDAISAYATRRTLLSLGRFAPRLGRVHVRVSDVNGPRGGTDKRCHVHVLIPGAREVSVDELHVDLYAAIDLALERAAKGVARRIDRTATSTRGREADAGALDEAPSGSRPMP